MRGLTLPDIAGVGQSQAEQIRQTWDTYPYVKHTLEMTMGIHPPAEPQCACPTIKPGSLIDMDEKNYSILYEEILSWFGYLSEKVAEAKAMVLQCSNEMTYIEVTTKKTLFDRTPSGGKKPTAEMLNIAIETDTRYVEVKILHQQWQQFRDLLQGRLDTVEANMKAVSRHIEIRRLDKEGTRTAGNINNRGRELRAPR